MRIVFIQGMSNIGVFNSTLDEFLDELTQTFPEHNGIAKQKLKFEVGIRANCRLALDKIMPVLIEHSLSIANRDETIIHKVNGAFPDIDFVELWKSGISDNTKNVIWDYINALLGLGVNILT